MPIADDYELEIREGNAETVGAACALFAFLTVGGFLIFGLTASPSEFQSSRGYGVADPAKVNPDPKSQVADGVRRGP